MTVAIMTDSNSGITQKEAKELGIFVLPMPFTINGKEFLEDINLTQDEFYEYLMNDAEVFTSQPALGDVTKYFNKILEEYDELVHIPMSSGLSGSCQSALMLSEEDEYKNRVYVVDSQRISVTQRKDVLYALKMAKDGKSGKEIYDTLMKYKLDATIYITVNTLEYLKKGGRLTPAAATLGSLLKIKPILTIQGEKLDSYRKTRTMIKAQEIMLEAAINDINTRLDVEGKGDNVDIMVAYTYDREAALRFVDKIKEVYPNHNIICDPLALSVSCHIGPHSLAIAACKRIV